MTIEEMLDDCRKRNTQVEAEQHRLQTEIDDRQKRLDELKTVSYFTFAEEIAAEIEERMPDRKVEVLGPFGLGCQLGLHVKDGVETTASLTLEPGEPDGLGLVMIDYASESAFPEGSIGRRNGLGHKTEKLTGSIDDLVSTLRKQESERSK